MIPLKNGQLIRVVLAYCIEPLPTIGGGFRLFKNCRYASDKFKVLLSMNPVNSKLANKLIELRGDKTTNKAAQEAGVHRSNLPRYESGERVPEDDNLELLANYYKVPFEELKTLIFEDLYPVSSRDRAILKNWLCGE